MVLGRCYVFRGWLTLRWIMSVRQPGGQANDSPRGWIPDNLEASKNTGVAKMDCRSIKRGFDRGFEDTGRWNHL
jgi:hypothetical protein